MRTKISIKLDKETIEILEELKNRQITKSANWHNAIHLAHLEKDLASEINIVRHALNKNKEVQSAYLEKQGYHRLHRILRYMIFRTEKNKADTNAFKYPSGFLLRATLPPDVAEDRIGNFENFYKTIWTKKHFVWVAKIIFYCQMVRAILGHHIGSLRDAAELFLKMKK